MVALRDEVARNADFGDYRDYAFRRRRRFDYTPDDCATFHDSIARHVVPLVRRLDIERGRLLFSGGPVNNPGVDIRAVKQYPDVKAGVNVRGTLLQPRLSFFSEPSLPQSQIVSLILAGGSIETAQSRNNPNGASNELLAQGSAILAQQLGSRVGLEDISLESGLDNQTSLVLGKYLSDRIYVSYGISFTEQLNTLKLRYTLSDRWTIKTEVGEAKGADIVFTIGK